MEQTIEICCQQRWPLGKECLRQGDAGYSSTPWYTRWWRRSTAPPSLSSSTSGSKSGRNQEQYWKGTEYQDQEERMSKFRIKYLPVFIQARTSSENRTGSQPGSWTAGGGTGDGGPGTGQGALISAVTNVTSCRTSDLGEILWKTTSTVNSEPTDQSEAGTANFHIEIHDKPGEGGVIGYKLQATGSSDLQVLLMWDLGPKPNIIMGYGLRKRWINSSQVISPVSKMYA